jgi:hypothetical protein
MTTLPQTTYFWRVVGAGDTSWSEAAGGAFTPAENALVEVVSVGPSRPRAILAATASVVVDPPVIVGTLPDLTLAPGAVSVAPTASAFLGENLTYALLDAPVWVSIDPATGEIAYVAPGAPGSAGTWRVSVSNAGGAAELSFAATVLAAAPDTALAFLPQEFSNGTLPVALAYDAAQPLGSRWSCDYDKADWIGAETRHYVNAASGSDANPGTVGAPWLTLAHAVATAASGDVIELAAGRYAPATIPAWTDISIIVAPGGRVIIADLAPESAITWGAPSDGYQTATLASGAIAGFTDLTQLRAGYPSVARQVANTAAGDVRKAQGYPAHIVASSTLGAVDGRDLTGTADTELLIWKTTAASPITLGVGATLYLEGVTLAGYTLFTGERTVMEGVEFLGSRGQLIRSNATFIASNCCIRGAPAHDVMDYAGSASYVELNSLIDHSGENTNDNCSTAHEYACGVRLGSTYEGKRPLHDISEYPSLIVDCKSTAWYEYGDVALRTTSNSSCWVQGLTLTPSTGAEQIAMEGPVFYVDEAIDAYANSQNVDASLTLVAASSDYADPVVVAADPGALSPLAYYDGNDPASRIMSGASVTAWNDLAASANLAVEFGTPVIEATPGGRGAVFMANATMAATGVAAMINAAQAFTLHAFVDVEDLNGKGLITLGTNANGLDAYLNASGGATIKLKVGGATVVQVNSSLAAKRLVHFAVVCNGTGMTVYADRDQASATFSTTLAFAEGLQLNRRGTGVSANRGTATFAEVALFDAAQDAATVAAFRQRGIELFGMRL